MSRRIAWRSFTVLAAMSLVVCAVACVGQLAGWGAPLVTVTYYDAYPLKTEYLYGIMIGGYSVFFTGVVLVTCWLPALWLLFFVLSWVVSARSASTPPAAA